MPPADAKPDSARTCPLCGGDNDCGAAAGRDTCWCHATTIAPNVLAGVPQQARGRVCVCAACARGEVASPCTGVCQLDASGRVCRGCGRTLEEIAAWPALATPGRLAVLRRCRTERTAQPLPPAATPP
jgi:predicted Fe-S protein YdhL (DUF1289 family)